MPCALSTAMTLASQSCSSLPVTVCEAGPGGDFSVRPAFSFAGRAKISSPLIRRGRDSYLSPMVISDANRLLNQFLDPLRAPVIRCLSRLDDVDVTLIVRHQLDGIRDGMGWKAPITVRPGWWMPSAPNWREVG